MNDTSAPFNRLRPRLKDIVDIGTWLPEPLWCDAPVTLEQMLERADDVSVAFLSLLAWLAPQARATCLMREEFDADHDEVALALCKTEAASAAQQGFER